ncbi:MAG: DUF29 domain-containing protein [Rhizobiaceae bacterium]|nr:DUF29 domain-containing protein [Rhizobiaceae bacterium]
MGDALKNAEPMLYDLDFHAWTQDQAAKLRARAGFDNRGDIDWENAAEEIESLGRSERREIESRVVIVLLGLLKWRFQEAHRSRSWKSSIIEQRRMVRRLLAENPSLANVPEIALGASYDLARLKASAETGLALKTFPVSSPFTAAQTLDDDFYPDGE